MIDFNDKIPTMKYITQICKAIAMNFKDLKQKLSITNSKISNLDNELDKLNEKLDDKPGLEDLAKVAFTGDYNDLINQPFTPEKSNDLDWSEPDILELLNEAGISQPLMNSEDEIYINKDGKIYIA